MRKVTTRELTTFLLLGDQGVSSYINKDGFTKHAITISPLLMIIADIKTTETQKKLKIEGARLYTQRKDDK